MKIAIRKDKLWAKSQSDENIFEENKFEENNVEENKSEENKSEEMDDA